MLQEKSVAENAIASHEAFVADEVRFQNGDEQKNKIANKDNKGRAHEKELVAVGERNKESPPPLASNLRPCAHCNREISMEDKFCMHCGASVASRVAGTTRLCSSCRHEIGASDRFCRYCGASSVAVVAPSMKRRRRSRVPKQPVEHEPNHSANDGDKVSHSPLHVDLS